jgi:glycosyltransferase involved in cell wall biosynthesis
MKRKILIMADNLNNGGAERQLMLLVKNIPNTWEVFLWSVDGGVFLPELVIANLQHKISRRKFQFDITPFFDLLKIVRDYHPDILHSWGWMSTFAGIIISKFFSIPLVNGIIRSAQPYYYRGKISRLLSKWGDVVVSNSKVGLRNWEVELSRGVVIYNGFDHTRLEKINLAKVFPNNDDCFRVVMAARMVKAKDFSLFISAARYMMQNGITNWEFLAIGYGEDKDLLLRENADLIQQGILEFPDAGLEVMPFLQKCNVGVLLTRPNFHAEGCSNTIMEYMACGLPVIATDNGGNKELVDDQRTGFIIPDNNLDELITKLLWLSNNRTHASEMGKKGQAKLLEQYSIEKMVKMTIDLYDTLLKQVDV